VYVCGKTSFPAFFPQFYHRIRIRGLQSWFPIHQHDSSAFRGSEDAAVALLFSSQYSVFQFSAFSNSVLCGSTLDSVDYLCGSPKRGPLNQTTQPHQHPGVQLIKLNHNGIYIAIAAAGTIDTLERCSRVLGILKVWYLKHISHNRVRKNVRHKLTAPKLLYNAFTNWLIVL